MLAEAQLPVDAFASVVGNVRGAARVTDDTPGNESLRDRARKLKGYTISVAGDHGSVTVKPLCQTTTYAGRHGTLSYECNGELGYAPELDRWVVSLHCGRWDAKYRWLVACEPQLDRVLRKLAEALDEALVADGKDRPLQPVGLGEDRPLHIGPQTLITRLNYVENLR